MIYILETELPNQKLIHTALKKIYGIGKVSSINFCKKLGLSANLKVSELSIDQKNRLIRIITESKILINSDLKKLKNGNNKKLVDMKSYKGIRKLKGFPVRGQRTRSNAKTAKKCLFIGN